MEGILTLDYPKLGDTFNERLALLVSIQIISNQSLGYHRASLLSLSPEQWRGVSQWLASGAGNPFWSIAMGGITITQQPLGHVLVGTNQLISDLADYFRLKASSNAESEREYTHTDIEYASHSFETLWEAALLYEKDLINFKR